MANKVKITKEQYNRIFATKLISESHIKEKGNDLKSECINLIKYMYGKKPNDSNNNILYDEVCKILLEKGIIIEKDGHYEISKKLGTPENAKEIIQAELKKLSSEKQSQVDEMSNYPPGVEPHTHDAPWNQKEMEPTNEPEKKGVTINGPLKTMGSNEELSILTDGTDLYVFLYGDLSETPLSGEEVQQVMSKNRNEIGYGFEDWNSGNKRLVKIDDQLRDDLIKTHSHDKKFISALDQKIDEMTGSGSAGAFTPAISFGSDIEEQPIKRDLNAADTPIVAETTTASPSTVGPYDANALHGINRDGSYKKTPKTKAEKKTQWAGGSFVEMDDCTKLNNNKTAQKGGCSGGAVDNVVKLKKSSGNINAPSLNEDTKK